LEGGVYAASTAASPQVNGFSQSRSNVEVAWKPRTGGTYQMHTLRIGGGANADILVDGCRFISPTNGYGMGLEIVSGLNATISGCTVMGGGNYDGGKGIYVVGVSDNIIVKNSVISTNSSFSGDLYGGGLRVGTGRLTTISSNTFAGNASRYNGGGAHCAYSAILNGNTFTGNVSGEDSAGGGVYCSSTGTLTGNVFTGNSAFYYGGGASCSGTATLSGNN
jgi:hypothetical protein